MILKPPDCDWGWRMGIDERSKLKRLADYALERFHYASIAAFGVSTALAVWLLVREGFPSQAEILLAIFGLLVSLLIDRIIGQFAAKHDDSLRRKELADAHDGASDQLAAINKKFEGLQKSWATRFSVEYLGKTAVATQSVSEKILAWTKDSPGQIEIKNTFVLLMNYKHRNSSEFRQIIAGYESVLSQDGSSWFDLISINELFSSRYEKIFESDALSAPPSPRGIHRVAVIRHNVPLINFIILNDKKNERRALYFGWVYGPTDDSSDVFYTEDEKIIGLFDRHFDVLRMYKVVDHKVIEVDYSKQGRARLHGSDIVDRQGGWLTVSFGSGPDGNESESLGLVRIEFDEGHIIVDGHTINSKGIFKRINTSDVQHTTRRIHFEYETKDGGRTRNGFCTYRFRKFDEDDGLEGFFTNDRDNRKINLVGIKLAKGPFGRGSLKGKISDSAWEEAVRRLRSVAGQRGLKLAQKDFDRLYAKISI